MPVSPLQISLILKQIFDYCPNTLETVQNHRLVCRAWDEASAFQRNILAPVKLVQDPQHGDLDLGTTSVCQYLDDLNTVESPQTFMHQNFTLKWWNIEDDHLDDIPDDGHVSLNRLFWSTCVSNLTTLTLSDCFLPFTFTLIPPAFWRTVPNLENLSLLNCKMRRHPLNELIDATTNEISNASVLISSMVCSPDWLDDEQRVALYANVVETQHLIERLRIVLAQLYSQKHAMFDVTMIPQHVLSQSDSGNIGDVMREFSLNFDSVLSVNPEIIRQLRVEMAELNRDPVKLRFLRVHNLTTHESCIPIEWTRIMDIFPKLEHIHISQQEIYQIEPAFATTRRKLNRLDVMDISITRDQMPDKKILRMPTTELSFDCGFETKRKDVRNILHVHASGLKKLSLSRMLLEEPYTRFPCSILMHNLTSLHLWGSVSGNLNFLRLTVGLRHLSWNMSCYDETTHGTRFSSMLGQDTYMLYADHIVKKTDQLDNNFRLRSLQTLDLNGGALSLTSLRKLRRWLPNLKAFGAIVVQKAELYKILAQWPKLECLELKHGSGITAEHLINAYVNLGTLQKLKRFTWKWCACFQQIPLSAAEICAVSFLSRSCGESVVHPWKSAQQLESVEVRKHSVCLQDLFEKALTWQ